MKDTNGYIMAMDERKSHLSKNSGVMNYSKTLVRKIKGTTYTVTNIKENVPYTEMKRTKYFKSIIICLFRGSDRS